MLHPTTVYSMATYTSAEVLREADQRRTARRLSTPRRARAARPVRTAVRVAWDGTSDRSSSVGAPACCAA